jgi:hypothetical protein
MRITVHAEGEPSIEQRGDIGKIEINGRPQWWGSGGQCIPTDAFVTPAGWAVAINLTMEISCENLVCAMFVFIRNRNRNDIRVTVEIYGEALHERAEVEE